MKKLLNAYYKIDDCVEIAIKYLCALLLGIMIVVCFVNTFSRYALHHSFRWAEEIIIYCAVWVTCVGASLTARADDHVTLDLLQELVKNPKVKAVLYALTRTLACFFLLAPLWVLYVSYPVGSIAMVLGYLRITPVKVKALWTNTVEKTEFEKINEGEIE